MNELVAKAESMTRDLRLAAIAVRNGSDGYALDALVLERTVWVDVSDPARVRVELLWEMNGPTTRVYIDEHDRVTVGTSDTPDSRWAELQLWDGMAQHWVRIFGADDEGWAR